MSLTEFDNLAKTYNDDTVKSLGNFGKYRDSALAYKAEHLRYILPKAPNGILDFGCGIGMNTPYLKKNFPNTKLFGCDISHESIKIATANNQLCEYQPINTVNDLEQYRNKVDVIFISTVFHHIPPAEHNMWIDELYNIMNRGDHLVIYEHNMKNPLTARIVNRSEIDRDATMLDAKYCKQLLNRKFLQTHVKLRYTYFFPWRIKLLSAVEHLLYFVPLGAQYCVYAKKQ